MILGFLSEIEMKRKPKKISIEIVIINSKPGHKMIIDSKFNHKSHDKVQGFL